MDRGILGRGAQKSPVDLQYLQQFHMYTRNQCFDALTLESMLLVFAGAHGCDSAMPSLNDTIVR